MAPPAALQRHANSLVNGSTFRDTNRLWDSLQSCNKKAANICAKLPARGPVDQQVLDALAIAYENLRKNSNRSTRKPKPPSARTPAGSVSRGASKGEPQLHEMLLTIY